MKQLLGRLLRAVVLFVALLLVLPPPELGELDLAEQLGAVRFAALHGGAQDGSLRLPLVLVLGRLLFVGQGVPRVALNARLLAAVPSFPPWFGPLVWLHHPGEPPALRLALIPLALVVLLGLPATEPARLLGRHRVPPPLVFSLSALVLIMALGCPFAGQVQQRVLAEYRVGELHGAVAAGEAPRLHVPEPLPRVADQRLVAVLLPLRPPVLAVLNTLLRLQGRCHVVRLLTALGPLVARLPVLGPARPRLALTALLLSAPRHLLGQAAFRKEVLVGAFVALTPLLTEPRLRQQHAVGLPLLLLPPPGHALRR